jgi:nucleoside-diphosphate-sugar epimerase
MSNVLVVGGAGYVGGNLTNELITAGHAVRVLDNLTYEDMYLKSVDFAYGDILDFRTVIPHLKWADVAVWLAAFVGDPACAINPDLTMKTNVTAVKNLVENFDGKIIFPSTCSVYGAQDGELSETSPVNPLSIYAESKLEAEEILSKANTKPLIFRLGTLFGVSDDFARLRVDLVLNLLTIRAVLEKKMSVFGGNQFRPLLHVRDFSTAAIPNINNDTCGIFNLHTENITIQQLAERISVRVKGVEIVQTDISFQDARNYRVSSKNAYEQLKFQPRFSIDFGIDEIASLVESKRIVDFSNPRFTNVEALKIKISNS